MNYLRLLVLNLYKLFQISLLLTEKYWGSGQQWTEIYSGLLGFQSSPVLESNYPEDFHPFQLKLDFPLAF